MLSPWTQKEIYSHLGPQVSNMSSTVYPRFSLAGSQTHKNSKNTTAECEFFPQMAKAVKPYVKELSIRSPHTLPEIAALRPPVFVSGWSLHPSWQFQCNRPHEGQRNKAGAYQQEWFHYRTIGQSLRHVRLSSTVWHRPSPYCGTMLVDREETVRSDKWIGIWWKSDSVRPTRSSTYLPTV